MDEPSRSPYRLDLDKRTGLRNRTGSKDRAGFRRLRFSFFKARRDSKGIGPVAQAVRAHA